MQPVAGPCQTYLQLDRMSFFFLRSFAKARQQVVADGLRQLDEIAVPLRYLSLDFGRKLLNPRDASTCFKPWEL